MLQLILVSGAILALVLPRYMTSPPASLVCGKCKQPFVGSGHTNGAWLCPHCGKKNPNLRLHYHSVASIITFGTFYGAMGLLLRLFVQRTSSLDVLVSGLGLALSATAAILLFRASAPWAATKARALLWVLFGFNLAAAGLGAIRVSLLGAAAPLEAWAVVIPFVLGASIAFAYVAWLQQTAKRLTASNEVAPS